MSRYVRVTSLEKFYQLDKYPPSQHPLDLFEIT